jgi:hypothetical protein
LLLLLLLKPAFPQTVSSQSLQFPLLPVAASNQLAPAKRER